MPVREPSTEERGSFRSPTRQPALGDRRCILLASLIQVIRNLAIDSPWSELDGRQGTRAKPADGASVTKHLQGVWLDASLQCAAAMIL